jgi:NAD(P)H-hydrate epimerase
MSGAIRLCGEAALRSGAGKVTLATRAEHAALVNASCPELMVRPAESEAQLAELLEAANVFVIGTGLGRTAWSERVMDACVGLGRPLVLDADALNILADRGVPVGAAFGEAAVDLPVLTPHPAEAARLLGSDAAAVQGDRVACAQELAGKQQAVVVLKGCGSVVAAPDGRYAICALGNPGMATAGSGDVLAGVVGALLAQGLDSWRAACGAVVAHAAAGDRAAARIGERGLMASDITRSLPYVLNPTSRMNPA